jgi:hypothetical protein
VVIPIAKSEVLTMLKISMIPSQGSRRSPVSGSRKRKDFLLPLVSALLNQESSLHKSVISSLGSGEFETIVANEFDYTRYSDASTFSEDYLAYNLLRKYPFKGFREKCRLAAFKTFSEAESLCRETNMRLVSPNGLPFGASSVIETARRKIARLLGPFCWSEAAEGFSFGPGGTTRLKREQADAYYKLSGIPDCTQGILELIEPLKAYFPRWDLSSVRVVDGNKVITVPKDAKTDRIIAKEPCMNIFVQKGVGACIRRRLSKVGIDLNDQTVNQRLAREGSISGDLATVDLSSASDTISYELVRWLLPPDWFRAMETCRSPIGTLPTGEKVLYRKFSSMGNGFTFELESLIFWALTKSVLTLSNETDRRLSVYGDDIICPSSIYEPLREIFEICGFTVNQRKSFSTGPFRESCGKHYFQGVDVTPIYIRKPIDSFERLFWFANTVRRRARLSWGLDVRYYTAWRIAYESVQPRYRCRIPDGFGDEVSSVILMNVFPEGHRADLRVFDFATFAKLGIPLPARITPTSLSLYTAYGDEVTVGILVSYGILKMLHDQWDFLRSKIELTMRLRTLGFATFDVHTLSVYSGPAMDLG